MTLVETFTINVPLEEALSVFEAESVLDAAHGKGLWKFSPWKPCPKTHNGRRDWTMRKGLVKGVAVPQACRTLNAGRKHITCIVKQRFVRPDDETIIVTSSMKPGILGAELVKNKTTFTITKTSDRSITATAHIDNKVFLPPPLKSIAKMTMDEMSLDTIREMRLALGELYI